MNEKLFIFLDDIIDNRYKIKNSGGYIEIKENNNANCKSVKIYTTKKTFALSFDNRMDVFNCFNDIKGIKKKNDGIIFFYKKKYLIVLLIELKSNNPGDYLKQLKAGKNFVEYILRQVNLFYNINLDYNKIEYRAILFKTIPRKGTTRKKNQIDFNDRNSLLCATLSCNENYHLKKIKEAIAI